MNEKRFWTHLDGKIIAVSFALVTMGIVNLYSATSGTPEFGFAFYQRQLLWFGIGAVVALAVCWLDYRYYEQFAYVLYLVALLFLGLVLVYGMMVGGVQRWIKIGGFAFQPSELMKIALILGLARYFVRHERNEYELRHLAVPLSMMLVPTLLIARQPDLGTAFILIVIFFSLVLFVKIRLKSLMILAVIVLLATPMLWFSVKEYQRSRILTFLNPDRDPLGAGYHIIQSKIAVGSGGIWGKGYREGTQCKLQFLPERHTDFVFAVLGEEWGFAGCAVVLTAYLALILFGLNVAAKAKDRYGALTAFGVTAMMFWHTVVNVGMVLGMMPVVGLPLPFLSYGGSFAIANALGIALLLNVGARRYIF